MRPLPTQKLDPKMKTVWRISAAVLWSIIMIAVLLGFLIPALITLLPVLKLLSGLSVAVWVLLLVVFVGVIPSFRYARWRYEVGEHELDIMRGIIWRKRFLIPFVRVQSTDTKQGPIMRAAGLASVTVATAAGEHEIPGLSIAEADALRDAIAEQARLAQEDV